MVFRALFLGLFWKRKSSKSSNWKTEDLEDPIGGEVIGGISHMLAWVFVYLNFDLAGLLPTDSKLRKAEQKSEPVFSKSFVFRTLFLERSESLFWRQSSTSRRCKTSSPNGWWSFLRFWNFHKWKLCFYVFNVVGINPWIFITIEFKLEEVLWFVITFVC